LEKTETGKERVDASGGAGEDVQGIGLMSLTFSGGDLAPNLGETDKNFRGPRFLNDAFFREKFPFSG